jgi:hypothetical protein
MQLTCPHCDARAVIRTSRPISRTASEYYVQCTSVTCAHTWKAIMEAVTTIAPSMTPHPSVRIPLSPRSPVVMAKAANDCQSLIPGLDTMPHPRAMASDTG